MKRAGARAYFVAGRKNYLGGGLFRKAWAIDSVSEVRDFQQIGELQADLVYDKGGFTRRDVLVVTDPKLNPVLADKTLMYRRFGRLQPQTEICVNKTELSAAMEQMPGEMVVVKNPWGSGGRQVYVGKKGDVRIPADERYPLLVQEFIDMSDGVPGMIEGPHDVRVLVAGGTMIGGTLRWPQAGNLRANVAQGGGQRLLDQAEIPDELRAIVREIDAELEDLPRYYSIDFARGKTGWKMIELNNKPGLFPEAIGPLARTYMDSLARYLVSL